MAEILRVSRRRYGFAFAVPLGILSLYQHRRSGPSIFVASPRPSGVLILVTLEDNGTLSPEPDVIQLLATAHFFGSKKERVTVICDTEAPTADQDAPTLKPD
jgi:hypothetical protein